MTTKLVTLDADGPTPTKLYCPLSGELVISATDPLEIETRLDSLSPYLRFVLFYEHISYPYFWAANPTDLSEHQRKFQELVIRYWITAADVGQLTVNMDGDWYADYLAKVEEILPPSSLLLQIKSSYDTGPHPSLIDSMDPRIDIDPNQTGYTIAACFVTDFPPEQLVFKRVKTMWDDYIPDFTPGKS